MNLGPHGSTAQDLPARPKRVFFPSRAGRWKSIVLTLTASAALGYAEVASPSPSPLRIETLVKSTASWDGSPYRAYPSGPPEITVLKIAIPPHSTLKWHYHPMPNAAYVLSGELTVEKKDGNKKHFIAGQALTETVDSIHRGITGDDPAILIVFYAGTPGLALSR